MKLCLVVLALIVGQVCFAEETTTPAQVKNGTGAPGRYHGRNNHRGGYKHDNYHYRTPIVDDYICDLEATILVVSSKHHVEEEKSYGGNNNYGGQQGGYGNNQGGYGGQNNYNQGGNYQQGGNDYNQGGSYGSQGNYGGQQGGYGGNQGGYGNQGGNYQQGGNDYNQGGNYESSSYGGGNGYENKPRRHEYATPEALRLKCSHIAIHSEHDCHTCCQLSARRYHSVSKNDIFGFIIDANEIKYDNKGQGYVRSKRSASNNYNGQSSPSAPANNYQQQSYDNSAPAPSYDAAPAPAPEYGAQTPGYQSEGGSYAASNYHHGPPKSARCVCCAPKRHHHEHYQRRNHHDRYDKSDSYEY